MTACRSSRFFPETRTWSPWVWDETPFRPRSLMNLLIRLALSVEMPALMAICWRRCPGRLLDLLGVERLQRHLTADELLLEDLVQRRRRSSVEDVSTTSLSLSSTAESVSLKSNRVPPRRLAWSTALRTSCMSTSETTSKVGRRAYRRAGAAEAGAVAVIAPPGRCPSGQREQAVNLPALPTKVQILPGPRVCMPTPPGSATGSVARGRSAELAPRWVLGSTCPEQRLVTMTLRTDL